MERDVSTTAATTAAATWCDENPPTKTKAEAEAEAEAKAEAEADAEGGDLSAAVTGAT